MGGKGEVGRSFEIVQPNVGKTQEAQILIRALVHLHVRVTGHRVC